MTLTFPSAIPPNAHYYKSDCGTTPGTFVSDGLITSISGDAMTISLTDGGAGDCDTVAGQITDPGGIVVTDGEDSNAQNSSTWSSSTTDGGGYNQGAPAQSVPEWSSSVFALSLAFIALTLTRKYAIRNPV